MLHLDSFRSLHLDANENYFLQRELRQVIGEVFKTEFPLLRARELIPAGGQVGPAAETWSYRMQTTTGASKLIGSYSDDLPRVGVKAQEFPFVVKPIGVSFSYSVQDVRAAMAAGRPLEADLAGAALEAVETQINNLAWLGSVADGIPGFLKNANVPSVNSAGAWASASATTILGELNGLATAAFVATGQTRVPDAVLLPGLQYGQVATMQLPNVNTTVLKFFLESSPWIKRVEPVPELATAGPNGEAIAFAYPASRDVVRMENPQPFEPFGPQEQGLEFIVPCHARYAGVAWIRPFAAKRLVGI